MKGFQQNRVETGRGVVYEPKILRSLTEICEVFGVGEKQVRRWVRDGAPIIIEGEGARKRYSSELLQMYQWREQMAKNRNRS